MIKYKEKTKRKMKFHTTINSYLIYLMAFAFILGNTALSMASDEVETMTLSISTDDYVEEETETLIDPENITREIIEEEEEEGPSEEEQQIVAEQDEFLKRIRNELNFSKADYRQMLNSISDTKSKLQELTEERLSLSEQIVNLNSQINSTTENLFDVIKDIIHKENTIALIYEQIDIREVALNYQKKLLKDYINIMYKEENNYFDIADDGSIDAIRLLLSDGSVGENLRQLDYLELLNEAVQQMLARLQQLSKELEGYKIEIELETEDLEVLKSELYVQKSQLEFEKESKDKLLDLTLGKEEIYIQLLDQTTKEQEELLGEIQSLASTLTFIEVKMAEQGLDFNIDEYTSLLDQKTRSIFNFHIDNLGFNTGDFAWPIAPDRGISAHFRDPSYVGVFGVQHHAVDIPAYQGSPTRAAADGIVYIAKDNGYGYSYIIIAHSGGLMSVYGHMSNILVEAGQLISQGSIIGLSGGMPGTKGAGYMTTGPHLHFEIHKNGVYVDPLQYLPLNILTADQIDRLPDKYYDDWLLDIQANMKIPVGKE